MTRRSRHTLQRIVLMWAAAFLGMLGMGSVAGAGVVITVAGLCGVPLYPVPIVLSLIGAACLILGSVLALDAATHPPRIIIINTPIDDDALIAGATHRRKAGR